ncbi:hypothetical protein NQ318_003734 [Aromia moschata]|uniref:Uncharacterized protein n=1 Tax=Aromia moschata TaxID=1265417 RepID=A0AAV8XG21_9CUCU|nr:hypothetical protein NQ318_003734 [Aromia moschata]
MFDPPPFDSCLLSTALYGQMRSKRKYSFVASKKRFWNPKKWFKRKNKAAEDAAAPPAEVAEIGKDALRSRSTSELSVGDDTRRRDMSLRGTLCISVKKIIREFKNVVTLCICRVIKLVDPTSEMIAMNRTIQEDNKELLENEGSSRSDSECSDSFTIIQHIFRRFRRYVYLYRKARVNPNYKFNRNIECSEVLIEKWETPKSPRSSSSMHPGLSVSHDSVFHSPNSGSDMELDAAQSSSSLSISQPLVDLRLQSRQRRLRRLAAQSKTTGGNTGQRDY